MSKHIRACASIISIAITLNFLTGCGGSSSSSSSSSTAAQTSFSVSGVVSDGAISDATVWLDLNNDGIVDPSEPTTQSDAQGNFNIETLKNIDLNVFIRAMGGTDTGTGLDFEGVLEALSQTDTEALTQMLTPLTTLEAKGMAEEEIRAMFPELPAGDIDKMNPNENEVVERIGVIVHSTIAQLTQVTKQERTDSAISDVYKDFADKFKGNQLSFENLPLEEIMEESTAAVDSAKASAIKTMIMETTRGMLDLDVSAQDYDIKLKDLQTFAIKDINVNIDNFMDSTMTKDDFMSITKNVRDGIIQQKINDVSGQITEQITDQVMEDNADQIQTIRQQMEDEIKADLNFDEEVEGVDPEIVEATEQQVVDQIETQVRDQIEQSITDQIQNSITNDFINSNSNDGAVDNQAIQAIADSIKDNISSQFGFDISDFYGGFRSRSKTR
tara:strand:- start:238 stop:1566 length:1329 start_codon:yes stop_codon:yes gene_type:complete